MNGPQQLPAYARALLTLLTPSGVRDEIEGDLTERFAAKRGGDEADGSGSRQGGFLRAHLWLIGQLARMRPRELERVTGGGGMGSSGWGADVRHALRSVRTRFGFSMTVIVTVALAVGATTSVFSVVNGVLLRPLDLPQPERLVLAWQTRPDWADHPNPQLQFFAERFPLSVPTFFDWEAEQTGFESMGIFTGGRWVLQRADGAELLRGMSVTSGLFRALGIEPLMGRLPSPEEDRPGSEKVLVLMHGAWQERFGGDADVLGRAVSLDGIPHTVIGVMPPDFRMPGWDDLEGFATISEEEHEQGRGSQSYTVLGRLRPGATLESAQADLVRIQERLGEEYPDQQGDMRARTAGLLDDMVGDVRATLVFLLAAVGLVLAIACVNIANMLSVGGLSRRRELAVKAALGASRGRLLGSLFTESAVLAGLGGVGGIVLAVLTLPALLRVLPDSLPRTDAIGIDGPVLAFGLGVTAATAILVGIMPALQAAGASPREMMDANSRGLAGGRIGQRVRSGLVVTEVALAFVLLVGASLLTTSFQKLWSVDRGFRSEGIVQLTVEPNTTEYPEDEDQARFATVLSERLREIPGARVTRTNQTPLSGSTSSTTYWIERPGGEPEEATVMISVVDEHYFDVMEIPLVEGRGFDGSEREGEPLVAVVNQAFVDRFYPGESGLGRTVLSDRADPEIPGDEASPPTAIVGVVRSVRHQGLTREPEPKLYVPAAQSHRWAHQWLFRVQGDPTAVIEQARQVVARTAPTTPVRDVQILDERIARSVAVPRFRTIFVVGLAVMATVLALLGVYGVMAFAVSQRTRELAVRMAIGAHPREVVAGTISGGVRLALAGVVLGVAIAYWASRLLEQFVYDVNVTGPLTYAGVAVAVAVVAIAASWLPARRAARVDPVSVLNAE